MKARKKTSAASTHRGESDPLELINGETYEVVGTQEMDGEQFYKRLA